MSTSRGCKESFKSTQAPTSPWSSHLLTLPRERKGFLEWSLPRQPYLPMFISNPPLIFLNLYFVSGSFAYRNAFCLKDLFIWWVWMFCQNFCAPHACSADRGQKRASNLLELDLQTVVSPMHTLVPSLLTTEPSIQSQPCFYLVSLMSVRSVPTHKF